MGEITEQRREGKLPLWVHPEWERRFGWLVQGTTGRGDRDGAFDLGLFGAQPVGQVTSRWESLRSALSMPSAVHARQVHGSDLCVHRAAPAPGLLLMAGVDGHLTGERGVLLTVAVADCVPVFLVAEDGRWVGLLHAGWRGVAAGIVERGVAALLECAGANPSSVWLHCGPSICGRCYQVGPEVHRGVRPGVAAPRDPQPIDLRAAIVERALRAGLRPERCTRSAHCTRCTPGPGELAERLFFSHRAGDPGRQMAVLGLR